MKLYYAPGACSLSPHIVLREAGVPFTLGKVDYQTKLTESGENFLEVNPKGYVPALRLDDGSVLTEGVAIIQYIADQKPESDLAPPCGSMERYRLYEWLNYISTELHKTFSPLFGTPVDELKKKTIEKLQKRMAFVETTFAKQPYLMGDAFTIADAYCFTVVRWSGKRDVSLAAFPHLVEYMERIAVRPAVSAALSAEGLAYP